MAEANTIERLRGLVLSAAELHDMTDWPDALVEDYLNIVSNIITLAGLIDIEIDQKIEEIPTDFLDGSVPFVESSRLVEDNDDLFFDNVSKFLTVGGGIKGPNRAKQFFFAGM
jgi:hypothetical protein